MRTIFFAAATLATLIAAPAFAQSFDPAIGSGNIVPYAGNPANVSHGAVAGRGASVDAYAQTPHLQNSARSPYVADQPQGYFVDRNSPGRW